MLHRWREEETQEIANNLVRWCGETHRNALQKAMHGSADLGDDC